MSGKAEGLQYEIVRCETERAALVVELSRLRASHVTQLGALEREQHDYATARFARARAQQQQRTTFCDKCVEATLHLRERRRVLMLLEVESRGRRDDATPH